MKRMGFWLALTSAVVVPLARSMRARRRRRQSRLHHLAASAAGAGETAIDTLSDLAESALEQLHISDKRSRRHAGSPTAFAPTTAALLTGAPRLVAQLRDDNGYPYRGREDWHKYGEVFGR